MGLVTGTCFAEMGNEVICIDIDEQKVEKLRKGVSPIYEPGLDVLLERNIKEKRISFSTSLQEGVNHARVIFLALPTPPGKDGGADLQFVLNVAAGLSQIISEYTVVVNKSTVPVGTAERVHLALAAHLDTTLFDVVSNPEFLREGVAVEDFLKPDRVVIGSSSERARKVMDELYQPFVRQGNPIFFMDERSAEITKYAANAYLAMRISFMNEIANICERADANVDHVRMGIGADTRIGKRFLFPGVGYGGSCFPKDVKAIVQTARELDYDFEIIRTVMEVNEKQKMRLTRKIVDFYGTDLTGRHFGIWGLSFKPETDDIREAPSLTIIEELLQRGATITAFDPESMGHVKAIFGDRISFASNQYEAAENADALVIVTEWSEFRNPDFGRIQELLKEPVIFDGRNVYTLEKMEKAGFYYASIGRAVVNDKIRQSQKDEPEAHLRSRGNK